MRVANLFPMAGRGNRFFQEKYNLPKPLIPIMSKPMFLASVESFPQADKNIFICLKEHDAKFQLKMKLSNYLSGTEVVLIDEVTEGQACTCLLAEPVIDINERLFIASCDYQMIYDREKYEQLLLNDDIDVIIWTFKIGTIKKATPNAFAYCRTEGSRVIEVVEKRTISDTPHLDPAVVGSFTYRTGDLFLHGAKKMIDKNVRVNNEFYVGTSINQLIEEGYNVVTFEIDKFISFGNPFELLLFQYWQDYFDHLSDHPYSINYGYKRMIR